MANVTKRTIDYYTNLGLLKPIRTTSNYRYYSRESLEDLKFIEACKKQHLSLQEIKKELLRKKQMTKPDIFHQAHDIADQIQKLQQNIEELLPLIEDLNEQERKHITKKLSPESVTLIQSLLMLIS